MKNSKIFFLNRENGLKGGNRVNPFDPFDPFEPHIINRGAKGVIQKFRENWVNIFEVFEQNGCEIINKKKYGHPKHEIKLVINLKTNDRLTTLLRQ
ncbi:hypothetical protein BpHYR1_012325 [Brachionus plicatilis]|uniref:Uncharacterized protein n=1 Tax=Brachionus plicatilis TaxID=10195 RepID=A0A3M7RQR6_BRAPC|nr:hypothetical protein BpHYR1_012325 [Brachionus plicatilis]